MTLNSVPAFSSARSYVLKLHRDARPDRGELFGKVEHVITGQCFVFGSAHELIARLTEHTTADTRWGEYDQKLP
ncbi:MAG: hypothetical protein H6974_01190 [Gammaproteobacteria bacterium]|nr:hypothetical protein [Gammaproteobacteria bacterium]MCP5195401.1 hypothetical protein [Gammaproteobacteria bacterium]